MLVTFEHLNTGGEDGNWIRCCGKPQILPICSAIETINGLHQPVNFRKTLVWVEPCYPGFRPDGRWSPKIMGTISWEFGIQPQVILPAGWEGPSKRGSPGRWIPSSPAWQRASESHSLRQRHCSTSQVWKVREAEPPSTSQYNKPIPLVLNTGIGCLACRSSWQ